MKQLFSIMGNSQRLDGGAMFGNVPKALWSKWVSVDENNTIPLCCRALLIKEGKKNILFEAGIGAFFSPKLKQRYGVNESHHVLLQSLEEAGLSHHDIDVVVLSHMHFDHAGGLLSAWEENREPELLFPNAHYLVGKKAWQRAINPCARDKASFIPHLNELLQNSGRLILIEDETSDILGKDYRFFFTDGHTPGLMHTEIFLSGDSVVFISDLIPGIPWIHLPVSMGYDRFPELLISEKDEFLQQAVKQKKKLFFTHDPNVAMSGVSLDENGRYVASDVVK